MAKPREKVPSVELSSAFQKKADLEYQRLRDTVARNLKEEMLGLLEDELHSDLLITNGTVSVRVHKCVVQARSRHFWQDSWLTQRPDPDSSEDVNCLEMPGLNGEQLMQFARQLYSVSDTALLLEEYIKYMPRVKQSSSDLETGSDSITSTNLHQQPDMEDHSRSCLQADNIGVEEEQEHVTDKRTSQYTDVGNKKKEQPDLSVTHCEAVDNDHDSNRKIIYGGQTMHTDSTIVSLPGVSAESQTVCTESKSTLSADVPIESNIVSLSGSPRESKIVSLHDVHIESKTAHTESVMELAESKIDSSSDVSTQNKIVSTGDIFTEGKIISLPDAHTESRIVCSQSRMVSSADISMESKIISLPDAHTESKIISLPDAHTESKIILLPDAHTESKIVSLPDAHSEEETSHTESKTAQGSPDVHSESKGLSALSVHTESKTAQTESKSLSHADVYTESKNMQAESKTQDLTSPDVLTESKPQGLTSPHVHTASKTAPAESKTTPAESKTTPAESKTQGLTSPDIHTESKTAPAESKTTPAESKTAPADSKTTPAESKTTPAESKTTPAESKTQGLTSPDTHTESKTTPAESKTTLAEGKTQGLTSPHVHTESKTAPAESKTTPAESKTTPAEGKTTPAESKTTPAESKTQGLTSPDTHTESKTTPTESKTTLAEGKTQGLTSPHVHTESKTAPAESKTTPAESKTTPAESKTAPADSKTTPAESKTTPAESKTQGVTSPDIHTESKTAPAESKTTPAESKTTPAESKTQGLTSPDIHTESKTAPAESKTAPADSKTTPAESKTTPAESKTQGLTSPDIHTESKTAPAESKTTPAESKTTPAESKTTPAESKTQGLTSPDIHTESKTTPTESKTAPAESKTTPAESKTTPAESKTTPAESKTAPAESKTTPTESKTTPAESKTTPTESKTAPAESKTTPAESKTTPAESKTTPAESKTTPAESKTTPAESKTQGLTSPDIHTESKIQDLTSPDVHTESKIQDLTSPDIHTESKTTPAESKTQGLMSPDVLTESKIQGLTSLDLHTESKAAQPESKIRSLTSPVLHTESKTPPILNNTASTEGKTVVMESKTALVIQSAPLSSQINENNQVPLPSPVYGGGTKPSDLRRHSEVFDASVCSDSDLLKEQLVHEVIGCSILGKDRLELLDFIQLEARIVNLACLADGASVDSCLGASVDSCLGEDLVNSDVSEHLQSHTGTRDDVSKDECLQTSSKILAEASEAAGHEETPNCDLVASDSACEQYKPCSPLGGDLLSMYLHEENCDCCLSVDGVHFMAHKCVLSARCEYFLAMFGGQWSESQMATVNLEAVSPQAVKQLLLFLYGGVINLCVPSNLKELFVIADMYGVLTFRTVLTFYVKKDLCHFFHKPCPACVTTTSEALVLCHNFHLEDLQTRCLKWMAKYFTKVWPTKTFSMLEDSIHQLCFESILSEITASNVLDIIIECNKLISSLPRIKWTETVLYLVTRLMDSAIEYTSSHFVDVLKTKEFLHWAKVASWKASVLEEIFYSVINSLPVDTACQVFQALIKLQEFHSSPDSSDAEITALLESMIKCCEKFFRTHIHHVTRSKQWSVLPPQIQTRILEISAYVYLPEPPGSVSSRPAAKKPHHGKQEPTLPIGITAARSRPGASSLTISAPARTGLTTKTSPHSGRRADKPHEARMSRSISESLPSRSKKAGGSLKAVEVKVRASSRDRHRTDSSVQAGSLGRHDNQTGYSSFDQKLMSARDESQGSGLPNARHFGYQSSSQSSRPGAYFISKTETKNDEVRSHQDEVTEKGLETEGHGSSQQMSSSLPLSSHSKSANGTKKLSLVGPKSHMTSKLPTLIRAQKQPHRQQSVCSTHSEVLAPECSSSTGIEIIPSECPSSASNEVVAVDCLSSKSSEVIAPEHSSSTGIEGMPPKCPSTTSSGMMPSERAPTSTPADSVSSYTADEGTIFIKGTKAKASVVPAALPLVDDAFSDVSMMSPEPATSPNKDLPLNLNHNEADHPIQLTDSIHHLPNDLHKASSPDGPDNSESNSQELSTSEAVATLDFSSYTSDAILSDRAGDGHMTVGLETAEVQAEVKIVHMSKTLNVGFIVPPD